MCKAIPGYITFIFILAILQWHAIYAQPTKIMILGESIVKGQGSNDGSGFRRPLHIMLTGKGYNVDFVGTQSGGKFNDFDRQYEGRTGLYISGDPDTSKPNNAVGRTYGWIKSSKPNIILLYIGTSDVLFDDSTSGVVAEMDTLLTEINEYERDYVTPIKVLVAGLINTSGVLVHDSTSSFITDYNKQLRKLILKRRSESTHPENLIFVDMETGAGLDYRIDKTLPFTEGDMSSDFYPNDNGYAKMARNWFEVLSEVLTPTEPSLRLTSPENLTAGLPTANTFSWDSIPGSGISKYRLEIAEDSLFRNIVYTNDSLAATSYTLSDSTLAASTLYYWRVIASNYYSKVRTFATAIPAPTNFTATTYAANKVLLSWNDVSNEETGYILERKTGDGNFDLLDSLASNAELYIDSSLAASTSYTYRIKSVNAFTYSAYSNEAVITVTDVNDTKQTLPKVFALAQNYPNPFNPTTRINYQLPEAGHVTLTIYDVLGNQIATLVNEDRPAGYYNINFNGTNLASGVYFYQIIVTNQQSKTGLFSSIKKFILLK